MIKLFRIDKLIWIIIQIMYISTEIIFTLVVSIFLFLYDFKWRFSKIWTGVHSADEDWKNSWGGYSYIDNSISDTFSRRYKDFFR